MSQNRAYLQHILIAIDTVAEYVRVGHEAFLEESHWQDAVIRQIQVLGEAVKRVDPNLLATRPEVPWKAIAGMRDVLVHN